MAGVALLGSPRSFMAKSSNFSGSGRKTVVTPLRLVTYNRPAAITTEPHLSPPSSRSVHRIFPVWHSIHRAVPGPVLTLYQAGRSRRRDVNRLSQERDGPNGCPRPPQRNANWHPHLQTMIGSLNDEHAVTPSRALPKPLVAPGGICRYHFGMNSGQQPLDREKLEQVILFFLERIN